MKHFFLRGLIVLAALALSDDVLAQTPAHIVIMAVEDPNNYDSVNSMRNFAEKDLRPLGHKVTLVEGDKPRMHHFAGLTEALPKADLLVLFVRRRFLPREQMQAVRDHLAAGKPLLGIRTANHAFIARPNEKIEDPNLTTWPEFTAEVLGGQNTGYETKGLPFRVTAAPGANENPILKGVDVGSIRGHQSLYRVLPLATDATPLLLGTAEGRPPVEPVAWTRLYGAKKSRVFYTSLGAPEDMKQDAVRRILVNGVGWTLDN